MAEIDPDLLETTLAASAGANRRLTTKEKVKTEIGESGTTYDTLIDGYIDQISDDAADYANLAADSAGAFPTFGAETLRATWRAGGCCRDSVLLLPWRPKIAIATVAEAGVTLVANTDYRLDEGWKLTRLCGGYETPWLSDLEVVVTFTVGWALPGGVPASLEAKVIEQVRLQLSSRELPPNLRSENIPNIWSGTYAVAGGDSISEAGRLRSLEAALNRWRRSAT